jgi:type IV pilus assembly protein PilX
VFVLIMISITFVIAAVSSRVVTLGERAARNDRARQTAFQAAEAALSDAEIDIMGATGVTAVRVAMFGTLPADAGCSSSVDDVPPSRGFCGPLDTGAYKAIFADESASPQYATFGQFTGRAAQLAVGAAGLPEKLPRYIIEKSSVSFRNRAAAAGKPFDAFIVTAIGYGPSNSGARVVLQGVISKPAPTN